MTKVRFLVKFGDGMPGEVATWTVRGQSGYLDFADDMMRISDRATPNSTPFSSEPQNTNSGFAKTQRRSSVFELSNLRFIAYEDVGTKSNVAALAVFGVLGLGARRSWTLITVGFTDREAQFLVRAPVHEVRSLFRQGALSSQSLHSLLIEGEPPSIQSKPSEGTDDRQPSHLSELERLAKLYTDGMLTEDEFLRMKEKLLDDLR